MATLTMIDDSLIPFNLPAVSRKKVSAAFEDGLVLLREAEGRLNPARTLAGCIRNRRIITSRRGRHARNRRHQVG